MLTTKKLADEFLVTKTCILQWVEKYDIPYTRTPGGHFRFEEDTVEYIKDIISKKFDGGKK